VPLVPSPLSVRVLGQLCDFIVRENWTDLTLLPFFSMADRRRSLHQELMAETRRQFPQILATPVPYWSEIERMTLRRAPLPAFAPASEAARIYAALWVEMEERMSGAREGRARPVAGPWLRAAGPPAAHL
jgi:cellulose biosynthesis protein BcsQ